MLQKVITSKQSFKTNFSADALKQICSMGQSLVLVIFAVGTIYSGHESYLNLQWKK